jgi:hypothetical protein
MVTIDILQTMKQTDENIGNLLGVVPLNLNLLHVATKTGGYNTVTTTKTAGEKKFGFIKGDDVVKQTTTNFSVNKFSDLKGQTVALVGSAKLMVRSLEGTLGYGMKFIDAKDDEEAKKLVLSGTARAWMTVSGWPNGAIDALKANSGISLVPFDLTPTAPYVVVRKNYTNMNVLNTPFMAVPSILVTRPFKPTGANGKNVTALQSCILRNLDKFQEGGPEWVTPPQPGWKEIKNSTTFGCPQFNPAR